MGRPSKPLFPDETPLDLAFDDMELGGLSYEGAEEFTTICRTELEEAVKLGEIETFRHKRRVVLVKKSVRMWMAKKLAAAREERARLKAMQGQHQGK